MALDIRTSAQAQQALDTLDRTRDRKERRPGMLATRAYLDGDHWQKGHAWGGPPIDPAMDGYSATLESLERDQAPIPILPEIIGRMVTGVLGSEPRFAVELQRELEKGQEPTPEEQADLGALNDALTAFWDGCGAHELAQEFTASLCMGRGVLRFFIPPEVAARLNESGDTTLNDAARAFGIEVPEWAQAGVVCDRASGERQAVYRYDESTQDATGNTTTSNRAEVTYLDEQGRTVFRPIERDAVGAEVPYDCNGRLWIIQAEMGRPLINEPQRALQRKIDFLNFILPKNAQYAGFRERHLIGIAKQVDAATGEEVEADIGPATVNYWQPTYVPDAEGTLRAAAAQLVLAEPVDSTPIRADIAHMTQVLLKSCSQLHTVISGDATASAVSRVQARAEFVASLHQVKPKVEKALRELLELVACMACNLAGDAGLLQRFKTLYRLSVTCRLDAGPLSPEEKTAIMALVAAGLLSKETAMEMLGVEDTQQELNRIQEEEMGAFGDGFPTDAEDEEEGAGDASAEGAEVTTEVPA